MLNPNANPDNAGSAKSKGLKIAASCAMLIIAAAVMTLTRPASNEYLSSAPGTWFYNLESKKLEKHPDRLAPFPSPKGGTLVKAFVFACGDCSDHSARYIGWLDRFNDDAKAVLRNNKTRSIVMYTGPQGLDSLPEGFFKTLVPPNSYQIRTLAGDWIDAHSDDAEKIRAQARGRCGEEEAADCNSADFDPEAASAASSSTITAEKSSPGSVSNPVTPEPAHE